MPDRRVGHKTVLKRLIKDERLSPHRRMLAEMLHLWLDCDDPEDRKGIFQLIQSTYGNPTRVKWKDGELPETSLGKIEAEATELLKDYFSQVKEEAQEAQDEISGTDIHVTSE